MLIHLFQDFVVVDIMVQYGWYDGIVALEVCSIHSYFCQFI